MSRFRLILLSMLAVFAFSAVASASASAARTESCDEHAGTKEWTLCIEEKEVGSPMTESAVPITIKKTATTTSKLEVTGGPIIVCEEANGTGAIESATQSEEGKEEIVDSSPVEISGVVVNFEKNCKVTNNANCTVTEPIVANGGPTADGLDGTILNLSEVSFAPSEGTVFATVKINGASCPFPGSFNVAGTQNFKIEPKLNEESATHKGKATTGTLKFGGKAAKLELTVDVALGAPEVGKKWSIREG